MSLLKFSSFYRSDDSSNDSIVQPEEENRDYIKKVIRRSDSYQFYQNFNRKNRKKKDITMAQKFVDET